MNFSEKLYTLRKKQGLSQEQLAECLNVSRQAISKWESGRAVPETDKLLVISEYFDVSLDYLMKEGIESTDNVPAEKSTNIFPGAVICISGILGFIIWSLLSIFNPIVSAQISESSMIQIDGGGILLLLSLVAIITGAWLLFRNFRQK